MLNRLDHLRSAMLAQNLEYLALNPGPSLNYLTGLSFHLMERPVLLWIPAHEQPVLIVPELEAAKADRSRIPLERIVYGEDETSRLEAFQRLAGKAGSGVSEIGIEPTLMRYLELSLLQGAFPESRIGPAGNCLDDLRLLKEAAEIQAAEKAVRIAEQALKATLPLVKVGMTELELANELMIQLLRHGSDPELPFAPIVASGPNSALPHATPGERALQVGDLLIIDWGAAHKGYLSDLTRTFGVVELSQNLQRIHQVVLQANREARQAVQPGRACAEIDHAARDVILRAGYGEYFIHRTGHGLGMQAHEPPYLRSDNPLPLKPGMLFTIEPGVYLPEVGGVRIEDDVTVTSTGGQSLSSLPRELDLLA